MTFVRGSILVLVDVALELVLDVIGETEGNEFRSLFSWMSLLNHHAIMQVLQPIWEFQSLFSWMSLLNEPRDSQRRRTRRFQSLFSWMSLLNLHLEPLEYLRPVFQSLFSWMSLLNQSTTRRMVAGPRRFNPCSRGCRS